MVCLLASWVGIIAVLGAADDETERAKRLSALATCDSFYAGPPDGARQLQLNWTAGFPGPDQVACFPPEASALAEAWPGHAQVVESRRQAGLAAETVPANLYPDPPPPTAQGVCCLGAACVQSDYFDCLIMDGYFRSDVTDCSFSPCGTGACCDGDPPECADEDTGGAPIDEPFCDSVGGVYLGGAACDESDPCQRFRIPSGFEIVEVDPGAEDLDRRTPRLNNCGELVFQRAGDPDDSSNGPTTEILLYDNGLLTQLTDNTVSDTFPDINDAGAITWMRGFNGNFAGDVLLSEDGTTRIIAPGQSPAINARGHLAWARPLPEPCEISEAKSDVYFYDGSSTRLIHNDGYSNQNARLNDLDNVTWTRFLFPCGGQCCDWTAEIMLWIDGMASILPSAEEEPQSNVIDNTARVAWATWYIEIWQNGQTTPFVTGVVPSLNDFGDIAYHVNPVGLFWQVWLDRDGEFYLIGNDPDFFDSSPQVSEIGELAWTWHGGLSPSGTRFMRRIRNGDVTFDGVVDIDDFIPLPGCWTGPVETDGLCECRFYDMDHDRDIDDDDFSLFMRVYEGPQEDCNSNGVLDLTDLIEGTSTDCNLNGIPDLCDIASGSSSDADSDGNLDECCAVAPTVTTDTLGARNRFLTVITDPSVSEPVAPDGFTYIRHGSPISYALRVTLDQMPPGFEDYQGTTLWAGTPQEICENSGQGISVPVGQCGPAPGPNERTMWIVPLVCGEELAHYTDWSELGTVHFYHETVVPEGNYSVQSILAGCGTTFAGNYSAAMPLEQAKWGDVVTDVTECPMGPPNNDTDVLGDVVALIQKFSNLPCAPIKARADLEPGAVDFMVNITDAIQALGAFTGNSYPFTPSTGPCS